MFHLSESVKVASFQNFFRSFFYAKAQMTTLSIEVSPTYLRVYVICESSPVDFREFARNSDNDTFFMEMQPK